MAMLVFIGFSCVVFAFRPILFFLLAAFILMMIEMFARRDERKRKDALFSTAVMTLLLLYSFL
jgi:hypothetical protein